MKIILLNDDFFRYKDKYAVCIGRFDGIHKGHKKLIEKTVALSKENNIKSAVLTFSYKKEKDRIYPLEITYDILNSMNVDTLFVIDFNEKFKNTDCREFIKKYLIEMINAKYVVCGYDFRFGKERKGTPDLFSEYDKYFKTHVIPPYEEKGKKVSSTLIRELLKEGKIKEVNNLLGRPYEISGTVISGKRIGRTINFPTANIPIDSSMCPIRFGVYSSVVIYNNKKYMGVTNIGVAPTVRDKKSLLLEVNILDFDEDIYNKTIEVYLMDFVRDERKFKDIYELKDMISDNAKTVREQLSNEI